MPELLFNFTFRHESSADRKRWEEVLTDLHRAVSQEYYLSTTSLDLPTGALTIKLARASLGSIRILQYCAPGLTRTSRTARHIQQDSNQLYLIWFLTRGELQITQGGKTARAYPGQFIISESASPFNIVGNGDGDEPHESFQVLVPRHAMVGILPQISQCCNVPVDVRSGPSMIAYQIFSSLFDNAEGLPVLNAEELATQALKSIALSIGEANLRGRDQIISDEIQAYVQSHISDPHLNAAKVAQSCRISLRSLYRRFNAGETFHQFVLKTRLEKARELIESATTGELLISEIAHMTGFANAAHFSRAFRSRFDLSPRDLRRSAREAA